MIANVKIVLNDREVERSEAKGVDIEKQYGWSRITIQDSAVDCAFILNEKEIVVYLISGASFILKSKPGLWEHLVKITNEE